MSKYLINPNTEANNHVYDLCGIINHLGQSLSLGHYTAFARTHDKHETCKDEISWRLFDDQHVQYVQNENQIFSREAYVLMYRLRSSSKSVETTNVSQTFDAVVSDPKKEEIIEPSNDQVDNENMSSVTQSEDEYYDIETDESEEMKDTDGEEEDGDKRRNENTVTAANNFVYTKIKQESQNAPLNLQLYTNLNDLD